MSSPGAGQIALINTGNGFGGECHLDAPMVASALRRLPLPELDLVIIENVGNLVCPAEFDVGENARAMVYAITEGEEKPLKYPVMFRSCELVVVNKMDLLPHLGFDLDGFLGNLRKVNPAAEILFASARTGEGVDSWRDWLRGRLLPGPALRGRELLRDRAGLGQRRRHHVGGLAGRRQGLDHLGHRVVGIEPRVVLEQAVLVLDDEEPGELLAELGQALADELQAADDGPDVARVG